MKKWLIIGLMLVSAPAWALPFWAQLKRLSVLWYGTGHTDTIGPGVWDVDGVAAPTVQWWASDPLGAGSDTTGDWTATGSTTSGTSPFCNSASSCAPTRVFDSSDYYAESSGLLGNPGTGAFSVFGILRQRPGTVTSAMLISKRNPAGAGGDGYTLYLSSGNLCTFLVEGPSGSITRITSAYASGGWVFCAGTHDPTVTSFAWANGTVGTSVAAANLGDLAVAQALNVGAQYGSGASDKDIPYAGYWNGTALTPAQWNLIFQAWSSAAPYKGASPTFTRATVAWAADSAGQFQAFGSGMPALRAPGINIHTAGTNYCLNSLDWSAHTDVGTSTVTTNSTSGPFSAYVGSAEADTIEDNDGAALEGRQIVATTTYTGNYFASAFVKAGTAIDASIVITTDGTGSKTCTFTGLDNLATATTVNGAITCQYSAACTGSNSFFGGFARLGCGTTIGAVPSATTADLVVGDAVGDTGTIIVSAGQADQISYHSRPCLSGATAATCNADAILVSNAGWPLQQGVVEFDYTPDRTNTAIYTLLLAGGSNGVNTNGWAVVRNNVSLGFRVYNAGLQVCEAVQTWNNGQTYHIKSQWTGSQITTWRDGVIVAQCAQTKQAAAFGGSIGICNNPGGTQQCLGSISNLKVSK